MKQRTITGTIFVIVLGGSILLGQNTFFLFFLLVAILGVLEFFKLAEKAGCQPNRIFGVAATLVLMTAVFISVYHSNHKTLQTILIAALYPILGGLFIAEMYRKQPAPFSNIAYTLLGLIYVVVPFLVLIELSKHTCSCGASAYSSMSILSIYCLCWANDVGAYLTGRAFGKHALFQRISPKKTWEGTIGGGLMALAIAYVLAVFYPIYTVIDYCAIACIIAVFGTLGDLVESLFKRSIDVKDSGSLLPGHGGILDRFDSQLLAFPFIYAYLTLIHLL